MLLLPLLFIKSVYFLSLIYFEFPLLQSCPLTFLFLLTIFNYIFTFFLSRNQHTSQLFKSIIAAGGVGWFLVVVSGASPFKLNTVIFGLFIASVAFNFLTLPVLSQEVKIKQYENNRFPSCSSLL